MKKIGKIYDITRGNLLLKDNLTGLYNHNYFQEFLQKKIVSNENKTPFGIALIDIDSFSLYNRSLGSIKGNEALKKISETIREHLTENDFCARYGGDVFAVIFDGASAEKHLNCLEDIRLKVENDFNGKITISAGFAFFPDDGENHIELINNVKHSLHHAKISGKNRVHYLEKNISSELDKKATILIVDDSPLSIRMIADILSPLDYNIISAKSGIEALSLLKSTDIDLILLDIIMPEINGYEVCRTIKNNKKTAEIPIIMVTSLNDEESKYKSLEAGADDFITKPFNRPEIIARTKNLINLKKLNKKLSAAETTVMSLANLAEKRSSIGLNNIPDTARLAEKIAKKLGFNKKIIDAVRVAAILHDIGKIGIPEKILNKKKPLNRKEWEIIRRHPDLSCTAAAPLKNLFPESLDAIRHHHERLDGSGYPNGLRKREIPITARIIAVVDMYEALISERPYRKAKSKEEALAIIYNETEKGKIDKDVFQCLKEIIQKEK
ncbi:MAG: diguanylate cyclase [Candidatus Schekmanbacteria bacterium]|nr:MAG: diguanylate cyclase [Candidatus Schekmanbacteria bacterium]